MHLEHVIVFICITLVVFIQVIRLGLQRRVHTFLHSYIQNGHIQEVLDFQSINANKV